MAGPEERLSSVVAVFVDTINRYDIDTITGLVADDVHISFAGLTPFEGKERVRAYFEWFSGYRARWDLSIVEEDGDLVRCTLAAHDRWSEIAGISPLEYSRVDITVKDGLISLVETEFSPPTNARLSAVLEAFTPWATSRCPELYTEDGDYAYYLDTGARTVEAMEEWKALASS